MATRFAASSIVPILAPTADRNLSTMDFASASVVRGFQPAPGDGEFAA
jgi:hypothetical protein